MLFIATRARNWRLAVATVFARADPAWAYVLSRDVTDVTQREIRDVRVYRLKCQSLSSSGVMVKNVKTSSYVYTLKPPTSLELTASTDQYDIPSKIYQVPYYSLESDAPERPREYAGLVYELKGGTGMANLQEWASVGGEDGLEVDLKKGHLDIYGWEYAGLPPGLREVRKWLEKNKSVAPRQGERSSQVLALLFGR